MIHPDVEAPSRMGIATLDLVSGSSIEPPGNMYSSSSLVCMRMVRPVTIACPARDSAPRSIVDHPVEFGGNGGILLEKVSLRLWTVSPEGTHCTKSTLIPVEGEPML